MKTVDTSGINMPLRHISIRVPWHDAGWDGRVCQNPKANAACLVLDRIRANRKDDFETKMAGKMLTELPANQWPACIVEHGSFMSSVEIPRKVTHPYSATSDHHKHILPITFREPAYSAAVVPFRWMLRENAWDLAEKFRLGSNPEREPREPEWLANGPWVQGHENQKALLDGFFSAIHPEKSLCFFYAKQTPLVDDDRRVIVGIGRVKHVGSLMDYEYAKKDGLRAYIWERTIQHSIRPNIGDGFLLPYHEILALVQEDPKLNPADFVVFAPEDRQVEFSYGAEHVTHDAALSVLLACRAVIERSAKLVDGNWSKALKWLDACFAEVGKLRGPYPGLGAALTAFGIEAGNFLAYEIDARLNEREDPWQLVARIFDDPSILPKDLAKLITPTLRSQWKDIAKRKPERLALLKLLARMEITPDQAVRFYVTEEREEAGIECTDKDLLENPYLLYEFDRGVWDSISVWTVDRGLFPEESVRKMHPLPEPSALEGATDPRRVRALVVATLEQAVASQGHTLLPRNLTVKRIRDLAIEPPCPVSGDLLDVIDEQLAPAIQPCQLKDGSPAYQLNRLSEVREVIRSRVEKRLKGKRHTVGMDWRALLDKKLGGYDPKDQEEELARTEKAAALKEIAESRISVLIGSAGTGKTTLLSVLCEEPSIRRGGVLLLAPTGKARVRLQQATKMEAQTLAQFLFEYGCYDGNTGAYLLAECEPIAAGKTVVVDECSMLTEEQLGALFSVLKDVDRFILVGDPRQLPPIGAGRPFVDIVKRLAPDNVEYLLPKVGSGYAELTIRRRQTGKDREDLQLADCFSGVVLGPAEDDIFNRIAQQEDLKHIRFVSWVDATDLHQKLLQAMIEELGLKGLDDQTGFALRLGGKQSGDYVYFNTGAAAEAEAWQILSPVRGLPHGVRDLNRLIQRTFRKNTIELAERCNQPPFTSGFKITKPRGAEGIVYGDKVINVMNHRRKEAWPQDALLKYVANGEIGVVTGQTKGKFDKWKGLPWLTKVEFSSQPGVTYSYSAADFKDEGSPLLELAYAITIHKVQGSEFGLCLLVLPNPCRLLSRELLYTALTRQRERVIVFHQGERAELRKYTSAIYSETAQRLTNLFSDPSPIEIEERFFEERLIHRSGRGELMRSKSEVIIADALAGAGISYEYERKLLGKDGQEFYPDFTIEDSDSGITYYWEHCGMLNVPRYRARWERKLAWYRDQMIAPFEEDGGENGTLIVTQDDPRGGINSQEIKALIKNIFGEA